MNCSFKEHNLIGKSKFLKSAMKLIISIFHLQVFICCTLVQSHSATSPFSILQPLSLCVKDYGAAGTGVVYDTFPIQSTIDACSSAFLLHRRPCYVTFPPGKYLTATLFLKSGVTLNISGNATILGGTKLSDYPEKQDRWYVVVAVDAADVGITGGGEINGQGLKFVTRFDERKNVMVSWNQTGACFDDECRPRLVGFIGCKNARIWNVRLNEPAYWWCATFLFSCFLDVTGSLIAPHMLDKIFLKLYIWF